MNNQQILECVPNISEGRDRKIIEKLVRTIEGVSGVTVLHVDSGKAANRTVITFVGDPESVCEAAFRMVKKATELIDMRNHTGEHPRFGAVDVLPLVPLQNMTMDETVFLAHKLGARIGEELGIPGYYYEEAATKEKRRNLATCRSGEYEGLRNKLTTPEWTPDFGPDKFNDTVSQSGAIALGARKVLIAYNVNLNTRSVHDAQQIAAIIREKGSFLRKKDKGDDTLIRDKQSKELYNPGLLKGVKGMGWYIEDFGVAQLSYNITDTDLNGMHQVFDASVREASKRGITVTGSELIGLVPLQVMLEAGQYFSGKESLNEGELIKIAIQSLGLDELAPFNPREKIIEFLLEDKQHELINISLNEFAERVGAYQITPAGGSVMAVVAGLGASLATMSAKLSYKKQPENDVTNRFEDAIKRSEQLYKKLLKFADEDARAVKTVLATSRFKVISEDVEQQRDLEFEYAMKNAIDVPFELIKTAKEAMNCLVEMASTGLVSTAPDVAAGALVLCAAVRASLLNIRVNASFLSENTHILFILEESKKIEQAVQAAEQKILQSVTERLNNKV